MAKDRRIIDRNKDCINVRLRHIGPIGSSVNIRARRLGIDGGFIY